MSRSSFFEFHVAVSGLMTARGGLETVGHNTANAATRGYSRQVSNIRATTPLQLYNGRGMIGTGSEIYSVTQIRDIYLDAKYWGAKSIHGEYSAKSHRSHREFFRSSYSIHVILLIQQQK